MLPVFALFNPALGMCTVVPEMNPSRPATVDPEKIVRAIQQNAVTNSFGSPALWTKIARYCEAHSVTLPSVRRILMAGAPVPPALMQQMEGSGVARPSADPSTRAAFLLAADLALLLLSPQIGAAIGADPLAPEGLTRWAREATDVYTHGAFRAPTEGER